MFMEIGILLFLFLMIAFAILAQARKMITTKNRQLLAQQRQYIEETEMVLKYATSLAFSSKLIILLHQRIIASLKHMLAIKPSNEKLKHHINQQHTHISNAKISPPTGLFIEPMDERIAIDLARSISRLKVILRHELHAENISLEDCSAEESKLEKIRLKLRISNCLIKANEFFELENYSTTIKMLNDNIALIEAGDMKDEFLIEKRKDMIMLLNKSTYQLAEIEAENKVIEQPEDTSTLATLFDQKQLK
ncbi:MAG: hypothetical protein QNK26_02680 [Moritella sp.]|uniref:hypothetical protein n=1 Tax=Moritella sp. TaxID=78556 RepID=UPI0029BB0763|nr:hypothetical protein [Moritella sp.]MDX2319483.1 hypothetical protein [Moritella sp.]